MDVQIVMMMNETRSPLFPEHDRREERVDGSAVRVGPFRASGLRCITPIETKETIAISTLAISHSPTGNLSRSGRSR